MRSDRTRALRGQPQSTSSRGAAAGGAQYEWEAVGSEDRVVRPLPKHSALNISSSRELRWATPLHVGRPATVAIGAKARILRGSLTKFFRCRLNGFSNRASTDLARGAANERNT